MNEETMGSPTQNDESHLIPSTEEVITGENIVPHHTGNTNVEGGDDELVPIKLSDLNRMKELIMRLNNDRKDKEVFADVTRRFMYSANSFFGNVDDFKTILTWIKSCFKEKNGELNISYIRLGKKLISGDIPTKSIEALMRGASFAKSFKGFSIAESAEVFERNDIPLVDITPLLDEIQSLFKK